MTIGAAMQSYHSDRKPEGGGGAGGVAIYFFL